MKAKITVSTIWTTTHPKDAEMVGMLVEDKPVDICIDYLRDALAERDGELSTPEAKIEILEE